MYLVSCCVQSKLLSEPLISTPLDVEVHLLVRYLLLPVTHDTPLISLHDPIISCCHHLISHYSGTITCHSVC